MNAATNPYPTQGPLTRDEFVFVSATTAGLVLTANSDLQITNDQATNNDVAANAFTPNILDVQKFGNAFCGFYRMEAGGAGFSLLLNPFEIRSTGALISEIGVQTPADN